MTSLAEALSKEIDRVRQIQDQFKTLRTMPNVIVEPQIMMMEDDIGDAIKACASGDIVQMLRSYESLKGWEG